MTFTYAMSGSDRDMVRFLLTDTKPDGVLFQDEELDALLALESGDVRYAAAQALDTVATNQALLLRSIQTLDIQTDPRAYAAILQENAKRLRELSDSEASIDWAEVVTSPQALRTRIADQWQRGVVP